MRYFLDTSALIFFCKADGRLSALIKIVNSQNIEVYIDSVVEKEFIEGIKTINDAEKSKQLKNYQVIDQLLSKVQTDYFTIGQSTIGGTDIIPPVSYAPKDSSEELYLESVTKRSREKWVQSRQNDAVIFSKAIEDGFDCIVTDNIKDFSKLNKDNNIKLVRPTELIASSLSGQEPTP